MSRVAHLSKGSADVHSPAGPHVVLFNVRDGAEQIEGMARHFNTLMHVHPYLEHCHICVA
jgi:hypothetical protein